MKKYLTLILLFLLFACNDRTRDGNPAKDNSLVTNKDLLEQIKNKDSTISSFLRSFNEIQDNLNIIKSKEDIVTLRTQERDLIRSNQSQIISDVQLIYGLLNKNKQTLVSMKEKLKNSNLTISELEKLIPNLTNQIAEQEYEITSLKNKLVKQNIEINSLSMDLSKEQNESDLKTRKMNTGYCAIGTRDGLLKAGIVITKGGIISIGKVQELNPNLVKGLFNAIDIYQTTEISIAAKRVQIISDHPESTYQLEDTQLGIKKLMISNPVEFWSISKYLVIEVSADKPADTKLYSGQY